MWYRVTLVTADVAEESIASIITVKRISELGTTIAVTVSSQGDKVANNC
jgi:hypothetical protein